MNKRIAIFALLLFAASFAHSQSVALGQYPQFVSLLPNGQPNSFGCVFTYNTNSTTPQPTYTDYTGSILNPNPVPLSAGGTANIWYLNNALYSIVVKTSGGTNCSSGQTILTVNAVNESLLGTANTWLLSQTFDAQTFFAETDSQLVFGSPSGTQTTLDVIPQSANYILHTPPLTGNDTLVSQNATQNLTNKNLTSGTEINGCGIENGPGTYACIANNSVTATVLGALASLTGAPSTATITPAGATSGVIGIVVAGAGITGTATIQQSGIAPCTFGGGTTAGDYVTINTSVDGWCQDAGATYPLSTTSGTGGGQVLGKVMASGIGPEPVDLFGPEFRPQTPPSLLGYTAIASVVPGAATGAGGTAACVSVGACFDNNGVIQVTTGGSATSGLIFTVTFGGTHNSNACVFAPNGATTAALAADIYVTGATGTIWTLSTSSALANTTTYTWYYVCNFH